MFSYNLPFLSFILLLTAGTSAQPYNATDHFLLDCGSLNPTTSSDKRWDGDERSKFVSSVITDSSSSIPTSQDPSAPQTPYTTARIFNSSFTYAFPVSQGPKFLRLYFYPATYDARNADQSFFSVSSNGYSLLTNFNAFLNAYFAENTRSRGGFIGPSVPTIVKEFIIYVKNTQFLNVTFTPSPDSYAFINGIEIVSLPDKLYTSTTDLVHVGLTNGPVIADNVAVETMYRLNVGGKDISGNDDTGMYRSWEVDDNFIFGQAFGLTPFYNGSIRYTSDTPNYTAPENVYTTQRSMGEQADSYNLTWLLPVDSGYFYMLRLHFCNIISDYTKGGDVIFRIFINNQTAEEEADLLHWTEASGYAVHKDYVVYVNSPDGSLGKQDLWLAMHPNRQKSQSFGDGMLNGLEVFKLSTGGNLASPNPARTVTISPETPESPKRNKSKTPYAVIIGGVVGGIAVFTVLVGIRRRVKSYGPADDRSSYGPAYDDSKSTHSTLPSDRCRRFTLMDMKEATNEFSDDCIIGNGGFGKVYRGHMQNPTATVAIKRLNPSSSQGFHEFSTEIAMLSKLRHVHLVPLIGYCDDNGEMMLVYDYMAKGTLREHLYKSYNPSLPWKTRLQICIGAAEGLHYLHTGADRVIIHRDVKSTNILLDENWVAKVSDFGLSKLGPRDQTQHYVSTVVKGSIGYVDPEYYRTQQLTDKSDVYSFGVVLLEVLCARPVMIPGLPKEQASLAVWGKYCYRKGTLDQIIDPKLRSEIAPECLRKFAEVANSCLHEEGSERLSMEDVVFGLELALQLQVAAEKKVGGVASDNQEFPFLMQGEPNTTDDDVMFSGSSAIRNGTSSISSGFKSETVFSEMLKPTGR